MENNGVNKATYLSKYWFKPQIKRVKRGVQVDYHGYHIMKAVMVWVYLLCWNELEVV